MNINILEIGYFSGDIIAFDEAVKKAQQNADELKALESIYTNNKL